ncbi:hypothetical protein [Rhodococcus opacus]|uniref:hypothetical protein n=1 Tax=Rhodococcus opacus TaxID=37919 RepID=UPI0022365D2D|nr:hypothetical protein [Rhodococcus opacus]UZG60390.1 hypothetical protein ONE62_42810 [Rhodococcus opacus]
MSTLGDAVFAAVTRRGLEITSAQAEEILESVGISTSATMGIPVRLRARRLHFSGTKKLTASETVSPDPIEASADRGVDDATADTASDRPINHESTQDLHVPFSFDWILGTGIHGIGSGRNLRGKSSVLHLLNWALTGRSHLQPDIQSWMEQVEVEWSIDSARIQVKFTVNNSVPEGTVAQLDEIDGKDRRTVLGTFTSAEEFEAVMGNLMLERLRLDPIAMWGNDQETSHRWPAYAAALTIRADQLDPLIGNEGVLATRMLQRFTGTSWAAAAAQAQTALRAIEYRTEQATERADQVARATSAVRRAAEERVIRARELVATFGEERPGIDELITLTSEAHQLAQHAHQLELELMTARTTAAQVSDQLKAERSRRNSLVEDALARLFFNSMEPTVCPRCTAAVTKERRKAEPESHACSLCSSELDLDALKEDVVVASSVPESARTEMVTSAGVATSAGDGEQSADPLVALEEAASRANSAVADLEAAYSDAAARRDAATVRAQDGQGLIDSAEARQQAVVALARAEGHLEALSGPESDEVPQEDPTTSAVVESAKLLLAKWLKEDQDPRLKLISDQIADLARSFGSDNINGVTLLGNANLRVSKGGTVANYGAITGGEKLRLKIATSVALITYGYNEGIGRHPGLLFIDSPASEEIPEDDLRTILKALDEVASTTGIQVFVGTRYGSVLTELLPCDRVRVAEGDDFVW